MQALFRCAPSRGAALDKTSKTARRRSFIYLSLVSMPRLVILLMWELIFGTARNVEIACSLNGGFIAPRTGGNNEIFLQTSRTFC